MTLKNENIICFAGEDWWYHNPHSNLHIMKAFAKQNRVLFVNSIGVQMPDMKTDKIAWKRITGKLKSLLRYFKKAEPNIFVLTPVAIPLFKGQQRWVQPLNTFLLLIQLKIILFMLKFENPILWVCLPSVKDVAIRLRKNNLKPLVYYCVDNISHYTGEMDRYILGLDLELQKKADVAFFVNHRMVEERLAHNRNTHHLGHGVDYDHFARCGIGDLPVPEDMKGIRAPVIGHVGAFRGLDFDLIAYLAGQNPDYSFVLIGGTSAEAPNHAILPNVHFLGKKPYDALPNYMRLIDCFGIFYDHKDVFNNYRNPKKLLEYLATGKPIVSVPILEMESFKELVRVANDPEDFNRLIRDAVRRDPAEMKEKRSEYAKQHTWDDVGQEAAHHILQACKG